MFLVLAFLSTPRGGRPGEGLFPIVGEEAPAFSLSGVGAFSTNNARGRPMVIAFWTTWCGACKHDLVVLEELHRRYGDRVAVVGVCPERWPEVPKTLAERGITFPIVHDPGAAVTRHYQRSDNLRYPFTAFVDERGKVVGVWAVAIRDLPHLLELLAQCGIALP
ncbi:MAG: TlpA family protein disulfide reductase [Candidatus Bipolaricaulota bacterium]|nr:TlpA family protein disulfide reductase [Candidatus Bipolaricaulota bacterium]